jgi:hypothetical protein
VTQGSRSRGYGLEFGKPAPDHLHTLVIRGKSAYGFEMPIPLGAGHGEVLNPSPRTTER